MVFCALTGTPFSMRAEGATGPSLVSERSFMSGIHHKPGQSIRRTREGMPGYPLVLGQAVRLVQRDLAFQHLHLAAAAAADGARERQWQSFTQSGFQNRFTGLLGDQLVRAMECDLDGLRRLRMNRPRRGEKTFAMDLRRRDATRFEPALGGVHQRARAAEVIRRA